MKIEYYNNSDNRLLGSEQFTDIDQILIPKFERRSSPKTISKFFTGHDCHRWEVKNLVVNDENNLVQIFLESRVYPKPEEFLAQTLKKHSTLINSVKMGTLVEVDFGYIPSVYKYTGEVKINKRYMDAVLGGEMHKRRLCIVVQAKREGVQLVPITSKEPRYPEDQSIFVLSNDSLRCLSDYNNIRKTSYVLCGMISTVSPSRILPPLLIMGLSKYRSNRYKIKLCKNDQKKFENALGASINTKDRLRLEKAKIDFENQKNNLIEELEQTQTSLEELKEKYQALEAYTIDLKTNGQPYDVQQQRQDVDEKIQEYIELLKIK